LRIWAGVLDITRTTAAVVPMAARDLETRRPRQDRDDDAPSHAHEMPELLRDLGQRLGLDGQQDLPGRLFRLGAGQPRGQLLRLLHGTDTPGTNHVATVAIGLDNPDPARIQHAASMPPRTMACPIVPPPMMARGLVMWA
jgi:hypothetical protein